MNPSQKKRAKQIAETWSDPEAERRHVADPDLALCLGLVEWAREDVIECVAALDMLGVRYVELAHAVKAYREQLAEVHGKLGPGVKATKWVEEQSEARIPVDQLAARVDYHPDKLRAAILGKLPKHLREFLANDNAKSCPLCAIRKRLQSRPVK